MEQELLKLFDEFWLEWAPKNTLEDGIWKPSIYDFVEWIRERQATKDK